MAFNNYAGMLEELQKLAYANEWVHNTIHYNENISNDMIVYLFNIYCTPAKFETQNDSRWMRRTK